MVIAALAIPVVLTLSVSSALAATVNTRSNVVFIVDESGSMSGEQAFLENTVIDKLDTDLLAAGVSDERRYGVVGFGGSVSSNDPRQIGGGLADAATTKTNLGALTVSGGLEDGFQAIDFALTNFSFTGGAAINFILVTDEARTGSNIRNASLDSTSIANTLSSCNILLNAIVNHGFTSAGGTALGIDSNGDAYLADGSGGFTVSTGGQENAFGFGQNYIDAALGTGGAAWDLNALRAGGDSALSFGEAFIDIKVSEIISQPPSNPAPIPLPAAGWLLLAGLGGLGALRRFGKA
jgi:hypothetical protein